jgi:serine protease Do
VEYIRAQKAYTTNLQLKNKFNTTAQVDNARDILHELGVELQDLSPKEKTDLGIASGVRISGLSDGKLNEFTDIKKGFVVTQIDDVPVNSVKDFIKMLQDKSGKVMLEGVYPNKQMSYLYAFRM